MYGTVESDRPEVIVNVNGDANIRTSLLRDLDDAELEASGYQREMPRQFSMLSLLALAYALICTWNGFGRCVPYKLDELSAQDAFIFLPSMRERD